MRSLIVGLSDIVTQDAAEWMTNRLEALHPNFKVLVIMGCTGLVVLDDNPDPTGVPAIVAPPSPNDRTMAPPPRTPTPGSNT